MREVTVSVRPGSRPRLPAIVALVLGASLGACNALTGAGDYAAVTVCTGSLCELSCEAQGGIWTASPVGTCGCKDGPLCGGSGGTCCAGTAPYCVDTSEGGQRCSACTEARYECGAVCCEGQSCLDASLGACGVAYGKKAASCQGGLTCPAPRVDGSVESADCCESLAVPGGPFEMGLDLKGKNRCPPIYTAVTACSADSDETPLHEVTLAPYMLDRFEVTVSRFRKFVDGWD